MDMAKLFQNGRSQAVRLPKEFRFEGTAVRIRREGNRVILTPMDNDYTVDDISLDAARGLADLRAMIQSGIDSGEPAPLDMAAIKAAARKRFPPAD